MSEPVLIDTGPLVALLQANEQDHHRCVAYFQILTQPPVTCWPVLTEAAWLLRQRVDNVRRLLDLYTGGVIHVEHLDPSATHWISDFLHRYKDQSPQVADASLVYLAESHGLDTVFTLDRRDFSVYRRSSGEALSIAPD